MSSNILTLRPGLLVALSTSITGGVEYSKKNLNGKVAAEDMSLRVEEGAGVEAWETVKVTEDPEEHVRAVRVRANARAYILSVCVSSPFGLLCPVSKSKELEEAIARSKALVNSFNETSLHFTPRLMCGVSVDRLSRRIRMRPEVLLQN